MLTSVLTILMAVIKAVPILLDHLCVAVTVDSHSQVMEGLVGITTSAQMGHTTVSSFVPTHLVHSHVSATWDTNSTLIKPHAQVMTVNYACTMVVNCTRLISNYLETGSMHYNLLIDK